jgi:hypothetical protein
MEMITIQYKAVNPKFNRVQYYLKECTYAVYQYKYLALSKSGLISELEILPAI